MRSQKNSHQQRTLKPNLGLFILLVLVSFFCLSLYRSFGDFPVWFDELVAKAFIFGLPLLVYIRLTRESVAAFGLGKGKFWSGAYAGLALGGVFGFTAMLASALKHEGRVFIPYLFLSNAFWWTFFLALVTAWWESLFFYGFVMSLLAKILKRSEWMLSLLVSAVFVAFHLPVLIVSQGLSASLLPLFILAFFAFGQGIIYLRFKSLIAVVVSHAFWGMALLVYTL